MRTHLRGAARQSRRTEKGETAAFMDWRQRPRNLQHDHMGQRRRQPQDRTSYGGARSLYKAPKQ